MKIRRCRTRPVLSLIGGALLTAFASIASAQQALASHQHDWNDGKAPPAELDKVFAKENVESVFNAWYALNERSGTDGRALVKRIEEAKAKM